MANQLYDKGREAFLAGQIAWGTGAGGDTIKATLIDVADYTFSQAHDFYDDVAAAAKEETSAAFAGKSVTGGVADANDIVFTGATGDPCEAIIIWKDTGSAATSPLIAYIDTATGLPVTPNGGDITVTWDNGANKIFKL
jgi:hypothetical protein